MGGHSKSCRHGATVGGLLFILTINISFANQSLLDQANALLEDDRATEAYELLRPELTQKREDAEYNLLLGIAALDAGYPAEAVFALERVLAVQPDNVRAQAELGRAYYALGENEAARHEFQTLKEKHKLPTNVAKTVDEYLTSIRTRITGQEAQTEFYLEVGAGYDTNVNSATDIAELAIPAFNNLIFSLNNNAREASSPLFYWGAGADFSVPMSDNLSGFGSASINQMNPSNESAFSRNIAQGKLGLRYSLDERNQVLGSVSGRRFDLDGTNNQELGSATVQWLHLFSDRTRVSTYGQYSAISYPNQPLRDVDQYTLGLNFAHVFPQEGTPIISAGIFGGSEDSESNRDDLSKDFIGIRLNGRYNYTERLTLFAHANYQYSDYGENDPLFLRVREDDYFNIGVGAEYAVTEHISLRPKVDYFNNDSSLPVNEFDRWQALITARYTF